MEHFTPLSATVGGRLLGLAVTILWAFNGRTAGVSGHFRRHLPAAAAAISGGGSRSWSGCRSEPSSAPQSPRASSPRCRRRYRKSASAPIALVIAGLLVGFGTRISRGCTSGHGVCGLARLSPRSFVAVGVFMATAMLTVFVIPARRLMSRPVSAIVTAAIAASSSASASPSRA